MAALLFFFFPQGTLTTGSATPGNEGKSRSSALGMEFVNVRAWRRARCGSRGSNVRRCD